MDHQLFISTGDELMNVRWLRVLLGVFVVTPMVAEFASGQHFDIFLARPAAGTQTVVGGADVDALAYDDVVRVFEVELGAVAGEFLALEPGVNHPDINNPGLTAYPVSAAGLQPGDVLRLRERNFSVAGAVDDLFLWNGVGPVSFVPATADFRIDGGDPLGSTAGAGGVFDDHPFLVVDSDSQPGIYLASIIGTVDGFVPSDPLYLVMGTEALITAAFLGISQEEFEMLTDDDLDAALEEVIEQGVAYVEANVIPEPASLCLAAVGCCAALMITGWRRRTANP
jgi:hypothetical protein